ncbi:uncharacterized protein KY384_004096 [Bacidia gigantensis]|uniref:uncharacterized protein n=1 Tax=Bacidia gigantensis TaxID=2732470 RepID=UPI001D0468B2|nr:uncharacterized protein KY384_004096 [Bacidia gigantensis]KAG8530739.1 hypothetical protein KY384_004096 [Bacidia gigantensis]
MNAESLWAHVVHYGYPALIEILTSDFPTVLFAAALVAIEEPDRAKVFAMAKRKAEDVEIDPTPPKRKVRESNGSESDRHHFRPGLFDKAATAKQRGHYDASTPYKHGVIPDLIDPALLRKVRSEVQGNLSFTPKETDIYKIHQSGDLANLDGLDDASLRLLPSLKELRDAMYSQDFRRYLCEVTGSSAVSGKKTDMAINVYTPGCHLLCHDDVIGTRRRMGGALRLFPTNHVKDKEGHELLVPSPDHTVSIPPAFNQLSFFAVQPGQSFHDVEEVYPRSIEANHESDDARTRIAISGWYHIPQEGEDGYNAGEEASIAEKSSLAQLQGTADVHDRPQQCIVTYPDDLKADTEQAIAPDLTEADLDHLLKFLAPTYLTPDTLETVNSTFIDDCFITLDQFFSRTFSSRLYDYITSLPRSEDDAQWDVARPPHKHRFLYQREPSTKSPMQEILDDLIPSSAFRKWLCLATGQQPLSHDSIARQFRRGYDYTLAQGYEKDEPRLEICLAITPSFVSPTQVAESSPTGSTKAKDDASASNVEESGEETEVGGYLAYMATDDAEDGDEGSDPGVTVPADMSTGGRATKARKLKADPAIYQAQDDDDDAVLFTMPMGWNKLGIVLRDNNTMRFVKYLSKSAKSDRWDIVGEFQIEEQPEEEDKLGEDLDAEGEQSDEVETEIEGDVNESTDESDD